MIVGYYVVFHLISGEKNVFDLCEKVDKIFVRTILSFDSLFFGLFKDVLRC